MHIRKYLLGYDTYERHRVVARLIADCSPPILDVGGGEKVLAWFTGKSVIVANLSQGQVRANGFYLPFADSTFDTVASLDVLEHIPPASRCAFIRELLRVCRSQVVICAPYGSPEHMVGEKSVLRQIQREGSSDPMLEQHVENGLPTLATFLSCIPENRVTQTWFSGYFRYNILCFRIDHLFGVHRLKAPKAMLGLALNLLGNLVISPLSLTRTPRSNANRMYVVLSKS